MTETLADMKRVIRLDPDAPGRVALDLDPGDFESPPPTQHIDVQFADERIGMTVGVWDTTTMKEAFGPYPGDEFIVVIEGGFEMLDAGGAATPARAAQAVCFRNGVPTSWKQNGYLKKYFLLLQDPNAPVPTHAPGTPAVTVHDPDITPTDDDQVTRSDSGAKQRERVLFENDAGTMTAGVWDSEAFTSDPFPFPSHEFAQILEGSVTITGADGVEHTFCKGDVFFIPKGTVTSWRAPSYVRKFYAVVEPR
jgi:uncharacterized cupin superfamily protein